LSVFAHGVKLSVVSNCPFLPMVSNCPVSNCPRCQIVRGVKLSWCQIVPQPSNSFSSFFLHFLCFAVLGGISKFKADFSGLWTEKISPKGFISKPPIITHFCGEEKKFQFWEQNPRSLENISVFTCNGKLGILTIMGGQWTRLTN